ncbi:MAG TPA: hypothetical protein VG759_16670 [Candidatus Angelobacter sp.]|jgi:hypothetical protein|nr:hypothetical protein [Candidatus Angelobacter sp.]
MPFWPWITLCLLGAYHGLNPGMGWLFALALGLQEKSRAVIFRALMPIALGHAVAISLVLVVLHFVQDTLSHRVVRISVAAILFSLGTYRIFRSSHPRGARMKAAGKDLFFWSFLMASAHGAGLMIAPIVLAQPMLGMDHSMHNAPVIPLPATPAVLGLAVVLHTLCLLFVAGALALLFFLSYEKFGLSLLQRTWLNFDLLWAIALLAAAILALFL